MLKHRNYTSFGFSLKVFFLLRFVIFFYFRQFATIKIIESVDIYSQVETKFHFLLTFFEVFSLHNTTFLSF